MIEQKKRKIFMAAGALCLTAMIITGCQAAAVPPGEGQEQTAQVLPVEKEFAFTVVDADGNEKTYTVQTEKETVGDALLEKGLIDGEKGAYGLYVKTVDGITLDFDKDGKYWAFYVNDTYAAKGVDATEIEDGVAYAFKAE